MGKNIYVREDASKERIFLGVFQGENAQKGNAERDRESREE